MAANDLKPAWYVLVYHDVSWEESPLIRHIGGTCPPDVFRAHVKTAASMAELVSVQEGYNRYRQGTIDRPLISFWFDDGLAGVARHAAPILSDYGVSAALSICPRFNRGIEMFWRFKLSLIHSADGGRHLRSRLRPLGYKVEYLTRHFTMDHFGPDVISAIDDVYRACTTETFRRDAYRTFMPISEIKRLKAEGWEICNHSASHYPIGEERTEDLTIPQFEEAERLLEELTGLTRFWVFPFARAITQRSIAAVSQRGKIPVLVGGRANAAASEAIYRIGPDILNRNWRPSEVS